MASLSVRRRVCHGLSRGSIVPFAPSPYRAAGLIRFASSQTLKETLKEIIPGKREYMKKLRTEYGDASLGEVKVENAFGGMRGLKVMIWEGSVLDPNEGIRFHGKSIPDCQAVLPTAPGGKEMLPESMFWLVLTGKVPTESQVRDLSAELASKADLPPYLEKIIDSFPKTLHPMTQLSSAVAALNHDSAFAAAYERGIRKPDMWDPMFDDSINLIAKIPVIAARIYNNTVRDGAKMPAIDKNKDQVANYVTQMGFESEGLAEYLRLYIALHGDHEGGNVSAHTTHLVGSALGDAYISYSAALHGLASPLHGLANSEVLRWILAMSKEIGPEADLEKIKAYLWSTLKGGQVVPGYGHAVLRKPDPRFSALQDFAERREELRKDPIVQLVQKTSQVATDVLMEHGKTKNPHPNVDAMSGSVLYAYGYTDFKSYTVPFGYSRALGALPQLIWDRALGLPIERPKSMSMEALAKAVGAKI